MTKTTYVLFRKHGQLESVERSYNRGAVAAVTEDIQEEIASLVKEGVAIVLNTDFIDEYENKINAVWDSAAAKIKEIEESNDPLFIQFPGKRSFEIGGIEEERDKQIRALQREYEEKRSEKIEEARSLDLMANDVQYSNADEIKAKNILNRFVVDSWNDYTDAKHRLDQVLRQSSDEVLQALKQHMRTFAEVINDNESTSAMASVYIKSLASTLASSDNPSLEDAFHQLPAGSGVGMKAIQGRAIDQARKGRKEKIQSELRY